METEREIERESRREERKERRGGEKEGSKEGLGVVMCIHLTHTYSYKPQVVTHPCSHSNIALDQ